MLHGTERADMRALCGKKNVEHDLNWAFFPEEDTVFLYFKAKPEMVLI